MGRGNFWEITYDPDWNGPDRTASLQDLEGISGLVDRRIVSSESGPDRVRWKLKGPERLFQRCDIEATVAESIISNCTFTDCRFRRSKWQGVKFSNCQFTRCDFSEVSFERCTFVKDCRFEQVSASAELFRVTETAISATAFMNGLVTNLSHAPNKDYQRHRFFSTRQKLAMALFGATRNEADVDYYYEAYEQLTRAALAYRVERHRFDGETIRPKLKYLLRSLPARIERAIIEASGWLTQWGRSVLRAVGFFGITVAFFAFVYAWYRPEVEGTAPAELAFRSVMSAVNITLLAGYTAEVRSTASWPLQLIWALNAVIGVFWYSLLMSVISRRVLR